MSTAYPRLAAVLAVLALAAAPYLPALGFSLVWDDPLLLQGVEEAASGGAASLLSADYGYPGLRTGYWRPVTTVSLWLNRFPSGEHPLGSPPLLHLGNILLHAAAALALLLLGWRAAGPRAGLLAALLFALWPPHTESAAFVGNRHDLLAGIFVLLSAAAWAGDPAGRRLSSLLGGGAALLAGGLSKESALALPAALLLWDLIDHGARGAWSRNRRWLLLWGATLAAALLLRAAVSGAAGFHPGGVSNVAFLWRDPALGLSVLLRYAQLLALPWPVRVYYAPAQLGPDLWVLAGAALFLALVTMGARGEGGARWGLKAAAWAAVFLLPVSGIVPIPGAVMAARHTFIASAGVCLLLGVLLDRTLDRPRLRTAAAAGTALLLALLALLTSLQLPVWRDDHTLSARMVADAPSLPLGYVNWGAAMGREGRYAEAAYLFRRALKLRPEADTFANLALALERAGDREGAREAYRKALAMEPGHRGAAAGLGRLGTE